MDSRTHAGSGPLDASEDDSIQWSQVRHFLHAPLRRPWLVIAPWLASILLSVAAIFLLPKKYMSSALVLVESEKVPESFIAKVATGDPVQRLNAVRPEILSRTRLERVIGETHPYPNLSSMQAVEKLRRSTYINLSGTDGFTIEYHHADPRKAQEVTDRLARLFIDETIKSREEQVEGAVDFLVTQVQDSRRELETKDAAVRRYKEEHMGQLPSQLEANLANMQMLQRDMQMVEENLLFAREKRDTLARNAGRAPGAGAAPAAGSASSTNAELAELNRQLTALRGRYTEEHPDVQTVRSRMARLQARIEAIRQDNGGGEAPAADTRASSVDREQLEQATLDVRTLEDKRLRLEAQIAVVRRNVEETPRTEQELATLTRDYEKLNENYTALLTKQLDAQMSGRLEQRWKGDRFRMLDPASLPEKPVFPNPPLFLFLGTLVGFGLGIAVAVAAEYLDPTVKDSDILQAVQGYPVLAVIPHLPPDDRSLAAAVVADKVATGPASDFRRLRATELGEPAAAGEAALRLEGVSTPRKVVPIIHTLADPNSVVGEELRLFASNLMDTCRRLQVRCLALTSALPGEGKSTLSLGLASALGREPGRKILLVEADLRRPSLMKTLGLPAARGLSEWLNGALDYVPVRAVEPGGFYLVTAGHAGLRRPEIMGSARMDALLRAARRHFDFVLLDAVPVLPVADTVLMQDLVDAFQLVVRSRLTPRDAIRDTLSKLRADRFIGVVLNGHREYRGSYKDYGYRRYGMAYGAAPDDHDDHEEWAAAKRRRQRERKA